ncbi:unnamed protein product, partial [Oppiella nova]
MQQIFDNKNFIPIAIVACIIGVALHVVGMIGAYLEHYGLSISYAVLLTLSTIILIISCFRDKFNIIWLVFAVAFTLLAYSFAVDCRVQTIMHPVYDDITNNGQDVPRKGSNFNNYHSK